jgi:proteasome lid subunit RPN8/RPN11
LQEIESIRLRELLREMLRAAGRRVGNRLESRPASRPMLPLRRIILADDVSRALFAEFAAHRSSDRGTEETGWVLLGIRRTDEAVVLATLPAGAGREADEAHVRFNSAAQAFASRVVRQGHRQLTLLGVVHTHPGSLRHPSSGDYRGDIDWVANLRGGEGVFGIGTADAAPNPDAGISWNPAPNVQCFGELCLSWYVLANSDRNYRPLAVDLTIGPDLAAVLRPVWEELELHAERLDRLAHQLNRVTFAVAPGNQKSALTMTVPLGDDGRAIRVELEGKVVRYRLLTRDGVLAADLGEDRVDVGVYLMLSELAAR